MSSSGVTRTFATSSHSTELQCKQASRACTESVISWTCPGACPGDSMMQLSRWHTSGLHACVTSASLLSLFTQYPQLTVQYAESNERELPLTKPLHRSIYNTRSGNEIRETGCKRIPTASWTWSRLGQCAARQVVYHSYPEF